MKLSLRSAIFAAFFLISAQLVHSQYSPEALRPGEITTEVSAIADLRQDENLLWYEDFDGGLPEGWINENANDFCAFTHTYQGPQGPYSVGMPPLNSVTAHNGFMILDSDLCTSQNGSGLLTNAWLQTPPIDIPAEGNLMLNFTHNFRYCCSPQQTQIMAEVSTNGTDWTSFDVRNGYAPNNTSPNPLYKAIDITDITQGASQVWIRFRKTGASHYWWMIDDVALMSFVDNDLEIVNASNNAGYAQIPAGQQQPYAFAARVRNAGGKPQTNVQLTTTVNDYLFHFSQTLPVIQPGQIVDFAADETFLAPGRGTYQVKFTVDQDQQDMVPENNQTSFAFQVTDTTYSRTGETLPEGLSAASSANEVFVVGNRYEIFDSIELTSVSFLLDPATDNGAEVYAKIYVLVEGVFTEVASSGAFIYGEDVDKENEPEPVVMHFEEALLLEPGQYVAALYAPAQEFTVALATVITHFQPDGASWIWTEGQWAGFSDATPIIDMHFGSNQAECSPHYYFDVTASLCGTASGAIEVLPLTGFGPYTYAWADFPDAETALLENLLAGAYEVTITDAYNCESTHTVEVFDEEISVEYSMSPALCGLGGSLELFPLNGAEPFTYVWAFDTSLEGPVAGNLEPGIYRVTVIDTNECEVVLNLEVENIATLPVSVLSSDAFCGSESGTITLQPEGGEAPFTYQWNDFAGSNEAAQQNLTPGTYMFTVTDSNDCAFTGSATVAIDVYELQPALEREHASCGLDNGFASIELLNGQEPFVFEWSTGHTEPQAGELAPGVYQVEVTDDFGCVGAITFEIENFGQMPQITWETINAEGCGQETGTITIMPAEEGMQYIYTLLTDNDDNGDDNGDDDGDENGDGDEGGEDKADTQGFLLENLAAGQYLISILNEDGCELIMAVNVSDEGSPDITAAINNVTCHGFGDGSVVLTLENAVAPEFLWDDALESTTSHLGGLTAGIYTVWVTDGDCLAVKSYSVNQPSLLQASAAINHIVCANEEMGSIHLTTQGGTSPYTYIWSTGDSVKDLLDVPAGEYSVTVRDFHECVFQAAYTLQGNPPLEVNATINNPGEGQNNGSIILAVTGGVPNYTFNWSHGAQSSVVTNLAAGTYTVIITDAEGCEVEETYMVGAVNTENILVAETTMEIFPNPAGQLLNVRLHRGKDYSGNSIKVEVMNILGSTVMELQVSDYLAGNNISLDVHHLDNGVYVLRLSSANQTWQGRFVKK
ncbi:MAG: T9SS C-terminal target domain-containing protein [Bacteroidetes bacterium]|nr:MAG: T9SS C-terminal target domain-containing protein [Bacteroidota bacterium]